MVVHFGNVYLAELKWGIKSLNSLFIYLARGCAYVNCQGLMARISRFKNVWAIRHQL